MVSLTAQEQLITITIITGKRMKSIVDAWSSCLVVILVILLCWVHEHEKHHINKVHSKAP